MSRRDERQLVACEECGRTYPGFEQEGGTLHVVGGPPCPNCDSSSFVPVAFDPSVTLSCPECGVELRETVELPGSDVDAADVATTGHDPDGVMEVTCVECETTFDVGYEVAE